MSEQEVLEGEVTPDSGEVTETKPDGSVEEKAPEPVKPKEDEPRGVAKRLKELTDARRSAEQDRDYWRQLAMREAPKAEQPDESPKTLKDFDYDEAAYRSYERQEARKVAESVAREEAQKWRAEQSQVEARWSFEAKAKAFAKDHPDFTEVFNEDLPISQAMAEVIVQSEIGAEVAYYLGKNADVAEKIAGLSAAAAAREIGRIEARLELQKSTPKPVSKAPEPAPSIDGASPGNVEKDPMKMSDAEYTKWFRKKRRLK